MLFPDEFSVGPLADALPLTLLLPRSPFEYCFLIGGTLEEPVAVCLSEAHRYGAFRSSGNDAHKGVLIPNVGIEVDPASAFDPNSYDVPLGAMVRRNTSLGITAKLDGQAFYSRQVVPLISGLAEAREDYAVGFRHWTVTLSTSENRRVLFEVDLVQTQDRAIPAQ
jgi:hypothetical protein